MVFNASKESHRIEIIKPEHVLFFFYTEIQIYAFHFYIHFKKS